jgi:hypothetical protein
MAGGKARGKQPRATAAKDALLQLQALHHSHREATRLFLLAVREGATDAQIAHALRQGLPHLTDPASLQDRRAAGKEPEGTGTSEKGEQPAAQTKRTRTTSQAPTTQTALLATDGFAAALGALPPDDWSRTWAAGRTNMLRRTSKRVREVVDKMRLPAVVCLSRSFWDDARNGTEKDKRQFVLRQLTFMSARCRITTLKLGGCALTGPQAEWLAGGVLAQCRELVHLDLSCNCIGDAGTKSLAGVLAQCAALAHLVLNENQIGHAGAESLAGALGQCASLAHLDLYYNAIGDDGAESLAGALPQCAALAHLDLALNQIGEAGAESLAAVLGQCAALAYLDLGFNQIGEAGAESLAGVLGQCTALAHLNLRRNYIGPDGAESLAGVLAQCTALDHLDLYGNQIGEAGAESLAGVLGQCTVLAHLDLRDNGIEGVGEGRLRASWRGQASGLVL